MLLKYKALSEKDNSLIESYSLFEMPMPHGSHLHLFLNDGDEENEDTGWIWVKRNSLQIYTNRNDKNGKEIYTKDKVKYKGKEYEVRYFEEYGAFGLYDEKYKRPLGRSGSSTKYEPYFMNDYHTRKMEIL